ncbi:MAG: hypothetical protein EOP83_33045, partial [Verrucomicrobiaceae bacterium]
MNGHGLPFILAAPQCPPDRWWKPNEGRVFPQMLDYPNGNGTLRLILDGGPLQTKGHPFFTAIGPNGRACVTCHQPADG